MKTFTPKAYNIVNPAGFDLQIANMQALLCRLTFMDTVFGRATLQSRLLSAEEAANAKNPALGLRGRDLYTRRWPQGRKFDQDIDLTFSDAYPSLAYFYTIDPIDALRKDWTVYEGQIEVAQPFNFMFWCQLNSLECTNGEILKIAILKQLNQMNNLIVNKMFESYDSVLADFTVTQNLMQYCKFPYYALRIEATCTYPMLPENGNGNFDPASLTDKNRVATSPVGIANIN